MEKYAALISSIVLAFYGLPVLADECFASGSTYNVCDAAKKIQTELAPDLPMVISSDLTIDAIIALVPVLTFGMRWKSNWEQLQARMELNETSFEVVGEQLQAVAVNAVCTGKKTRAFLTLGGVIEYQYRTSDGYNIFKASVASCEAR